MSACCRTPSKCPANQCDPIKVSWIPKLFGPASMRRLTMPAAAALCAIPVLRFLRGYTWPMALVTALAIGALAYALRRTLLHMHMAQQAHRVPSIEPNPAEPKPAEPIPTDAGPQEDHG